jgi:hypothetical protein
MANARERAEILTPGREGAKGSLGGLAVWREMIARCRDANGVNHEMHETFMPRMRMNSTGFTAKEKGKKMGSEQFCPLFPAGKRTDTD